MIPRARIVDPARMLAGYTFTVPSANPCFVIGCYGHRTHATTHRTYGDVYACQGHDPERHGMGRRPAAAQAAHGPQDAPGGAGGSKVPSTPRPPQIPPDDGEALEEPTIGAMRTNAKVRDYIERFAPRTIAPVVDVGF